MRRSCIGRISLSAFTRVCAVLLVLAVLLPFLPAGLTARAADKPSFSVAADVTTVYAGDTLIVYFAINNDTAQTVDAFHGTFSFNTDLFRYSSAVLQPEMIVRVNDADHQTVSTDNTYISTGVLGFTFSDPTKALVSAGRGMTFLAIHLKVIGDGGTGQIKGSIRSCYSGEVSFGAIDIAQQMITVSAAPTIAPAQQIGSGDARLTSLEVTFGQLVPAFNPEFTAYSVTVDSDVETIRISAAAASTEAQILGEGIKTLAFGVNTFTVTVIAGNGAQMYYGVIVTRSTAAATTVSASDVLTIDVAGTPSENADPTGATAAVIPTAGSSSVIPAADGGTTAESGALRVLGISLGVVALFLFGFLAGFFLDKNMKRRRLAEQQLSEIDRRIRRSRPETDYYDYDGEEDYDGDYVEDEDYEEYNGDGDYSDGDVAEDEEYDEYGGY